MYLILAFHLQNFILSVSAVCALLFFACYSVVAIPCDVFYLLVPFCGFLARSALEMRLVVLSLANIRCSIIFGLSVCLSYFVDTLTNITKSSSISHITHLQFNTSGSLLKVSRLSSLLSFGIAFQLSVEPWFVLLMLTNLHVAALSLRCQYVAKLTVKV